MAKRHFKPIPSLTTEQIARFWRYTDKRGPDECWEWRGKRLPKGYGQFAIGTIWMLASRTSYAINHGIDPGDLCVCHRCDNPPCVNPSHLFLGTAQDNLRDMVAKGRGDKRDRREYVPRGERSPHSKLTEQQVITIRERYAIGGISLKTLAKEYGLCPQTIHEIVRREIWTHL